MNSVTSFVYFLFIYNSRSFATNLTNIQPNDYHSDQSDLFDVVEGGEDDVVASSHQTHGRQQLQNQSFGPDNQTRHSSDNKLDLVYSSTVLL